MLSRRHLRSIVVTLGLVLVGAVVGAALGAAVLAALRLLSDGPDGSPHVVNAFWMAGVAGAVCGALALPLAGWDGLRHVPLGRLLAETTVGTVVGGAVGLLASGHDPLNAVRGALAGFLLVVVRLRWRHRHSPSVAAGPGNAA